MENGKDQTNLTNMMIAKTHNLAQLFQSCNISFNGYRRILGRNSKQLKGWEGLNMTTGWLVIYTAVVVRLKHF